MTWGAWGYSIHKHGEGQCSLNHSVECMQACIISGRFFLIKEKCKSWTWLNQTMTSLAGIWQSLIVTLVGSYDIHAYIQVTPHNCLAHINFTLVSDCVPLYTHVWNDLIITSSYNMYVV